MALCKYKKEQSHNLAVLSEEIDRKTKASLSTLPKRPSVIDQSTPSGDILLAVQCLPFCLSSFIDDSREIRWIPSTGGGSDSCLKHEPGTG